METVALYGRVSTAEQAKEGYSLGEQESRLRMFAEAHAWNIEKCYMDGGFSGAKMDRPGLQQLIDDAENHRINKVIVYKLDRLSRSQKDTLYLIEDVFLKNNVDFVSMSETIDTSTPFGMAMIGILSVFAQLERETIKERMMMGKNASIEAGKFHGAGGGVPIGFKKTGTKIIHDEYEVMIVQEVFRRFIEGDSYHKMMNDLENEHPIRNAKWSRMRISGILDNPIYIGKQNWHGEIKDADIEPIISLETWDAARKLRELRGAAYEKHQTSYKHIAMLGGMLFCGECGRRMHASFAKGRKGVKYYYYRDSDSLEIQTAGYTYFKKHRYRRDDIDKVVIEEIKRLSADRQIINNKIDESAVNIRRKETIEKRLEEIKARQSKLIDLYSMGMIDKDMIQEKTAPLKAEREKLEADLKSIPTPDSTKAIEINENLDTFDTLINNITDNMQLYTIVHALIRSVTVYKDKVQIQWNF